MGNENAANLVLLANATEKNTSPIAITTSSAVESQGGKLETWHTSSMDGVPLPVVEQAKTTTTQQQSPFSRGIINDPNKYMCALSKYTFINSYL